MTNKQTRSGKSQLNFLDEIIVDNFAGGGGASTGMELATGRPVAIAINHDPDAILMNEKTVYTCTDQEHDAWVCGKCGYIENFEADGPEENGWRFCPACGREIVIADKTSELTEKQWDWIMGRFSRAE